LRGRRQARKQESGSPSDRTDEVQDRPVSSDWCRLCWSDLVSEPCRFTLAETAKTEQRDDPMVLGWPSLKEKAVNTANLQLKGVLGDALETAEAKAYSEAEERDELSEPNADAIAFPIAGRTNIPYPGQQGQQSGWSSSRY
jgi:hypothetical protein